MIGRSFLTMLTAFLWIIFLGAIMGIGVLVVRKFPQLVLLDVETVASEHEKKVKYDILRQRVERTSREMAHTVQRGLRPLGRLLLTWFRAMYNRVLEWERVYRRGSHAGDAAKRITAFMEEARALAKDGEFAEAERRLVSAIALDPKYVKAYEEIGRIAMKQKHWNEAEQAFQYVLKLNPNDASTHAYYGELESERGNVSAALLHFEDAVRRKPASPKYLSFLLEAAILAGNRDLARETFGRLKEINPENQKLPQFEQKVRDMQTVTTPT